MSEELVRQIRARLDRLGKERIWRPVRTPGGELLADGVGWDEDGLPADLCGLDFTGRSVVDIGCNLGHFSRIAAGCGAASVLGVDMDEEVVECAGLLARLHGLDNLEFTAADVIARPLGRTFDISLMIDIIGRGIVRKGKAGLFLDAAASLASETMIHTMRPVYPLAELDCSASDLLAHYPPAFVRDESFYLLEYAMDRFAPSWTGQVLTKEQSLGQRYKYLVRFDLNR